MKTKKQNRFKKMDSGQFFSNFLIRSILISMSAGVLISFFIFNAIHPVINFEFLQYVNWLTMGQLILPVLGLWLASYLVIHYKRKQLHFEH